MLRPGRAGYLRLESIQVGRANAPWLHRPNENLFSPVLTSVLNRDRAPRGFIARRIDDAEVERRARAGAPQLPMHRKRLLIEIRDNPERLERGIREALELDRLPDTAEAAVPGLLSVRHFGHWRPTHAGGQDWIRG